LSLVDGSGKLSEIQTPPPAPALPGPLTPTTAQQIDVPVALHKRPASESDGKGREETWHGHEQRLEYINTIDRLSVKLKRLHHP